MPPTFTSDEVHENYRTAMSSVGVFIEGRRPHCDALVLHAPDTCQYCDWHLSEQHAREVLGICFTGETPVGFKQPCPSERLRPVGLIEQWSGNAVRLYDPVVTYDGQSAALTETGPVILGAVEWTDQDFTATAVGLVDAQTPLHDKLCDDGHLIDADHSAYPCTGSKHLPDGREIICTDGSHKVPIQHTWFGIPIVVDDRLPRDTIYIVAPDGVATIVSVPVEPPAIAVTVDTEGILDAAVRLHDALYWQPGGVEAIQAMSNDAARAFADLQHLINDARSTGAIDHAVHPQVAKSLPALADDADKQLRATCAAAGVSVKSAAAAWPEVAQRVGYIERLRFDTHVATGGA